MKNYFFQKGSGENNISFSSSHLDEVGAMRGTENDLGELGVVRGAEKLTHLLQCVLEADGPEQLIKAGLMSREWFT